MSSCVLASANPKKIAELSAILSAYNIEAIPQSQFNLDEADETGTTFIENAIIKARHAARHSGMAAIADDSGICVPTLGGAPGIYSARYAGTHSSDADNNSKLLHALHDKNDRNAYYVCIIAYLRHADDPLPLIAQGLWHGSILEAPRGNGGFGYDPLFYLPAQSCTAAELPPHEKNRISHRAIALKQLQTLLDSHHDSTRQP